MLYLGKNAVVPAITVSGGEVISVITATNNTGSAISEGDEVWVEKIISDGITTYTIKDFYQTLKPNYKVNGQIYKFPDGAYGSFSASNYFTLDKNISVASTFEAIIKFTTSTNDISNFQNILDFDPFTELFIENGELRVYASIPDSYISCGSVSLSTVYWAKIVKANGTTTLSYSTDGETFTGEVSISGDTETEIHNKKIGAGLYSNRAFNGTIFLEESYIEIDGIMYEYSSSDAFTGIAQENIVVGSTGLVNVGAVIEPTGSITITENGTHDVTDYAEAVVNVTVPVVDKYKVGDRVNDDSNNPVGTVSGIKTDGNGQRYAVICLDGSYRGNGQYHSTRSEITGLPSYANRSVWSNKETATNNTQKILDYASSQGTSSSACNLCRAASFIINDVTYHGQFPTVDELVVIFTSMEIINAQDTAGINAIPGNGDVWSSTQCGSSVSWMSIGDGAITNYYMDSSFFVIPSHEIPLDN